MIYSASLLCPVNSSPIINGWVETDASGKILSLNDSPAPVDCLHLEGVLIPGFINSHCHLELSHLRGRIAEHTGMTAFIRSLIAQRFIIPMEDQINAMQIAEYEMLENGIVAIGDISNFDSSLKIKKNNRLYYHTFVEVLGLNPEMAGIIIEKAIGLREQFTAIANHQSSITPHAPYSMSDALFEVTNILGNGVPVSIHMEESMDEDEFCRTASGPIAEFYSEMNILFEHFNADKNLSPIVQTLPKLDQCGHLQMVHNTFLTKEEMQWAEEINKGITWCLCPAANQYISNRLPDLYLFNSSTNKITVGTDSLASNHRLSILHELQIIQEAAPSISFDKLIRWSTLNGAEFLGINQQYGSIEKNKTPGLVLLENINVENPVIGKTTTTRRII